MLGFDMQYTAQLAAQDQARLASVMAVADRIVVKTEADAARKQAAQLKVWEQEMQLSARVSRRARARPVEPEAPLVAPEASPVGRRASPAAGGFSVAFSVSPDCLAARARFLWVPRSEAPPGLTRLWLRRCLVAGQSRLRPADGLYRLRLAAGRYPAVSDRTRS